MKTKQLTEYQRECLDIIKANFKSKWFKADELNCLITRPQQTPHILFQKGYLKRKELKSGVQYMVKE